MVVKPLPRRHHITIPVVGHAYESQPSRRPGSCPGLHSIPQGTAVVACGVSVQPDTHPWCQGQFEDAMRLFRTALSVQPTHPKAMVGLGLALGRTGAHIQAHKLLTEYRRVHPDTGDEDAVAAHMEMGLALYKQVCHCGLLPSLRAHVRHTHHGAWQGKYVESSSHFRGVLHLISVLFAAVNGTTFEAGDTSAAAKQHVATLRALTCQFVPLATKLTSSCVAPPQNGYRRFKTVHGATWLRACRAPVP